MADNEKTIVIENTRPTIITLAESGDPQIDKKAPKDRVSACRLEPGENDVPLQDWEYYKSRKPIQNYLECGHIKVINAKKARKMADNPQDQSEEKMLRTIGKVTKDNSDFLDKWAKKDKRPRVQTAIRDKKKELGE